MDEMENRDILGIGQVEAFARYKDDCGWLVVSPGCEDRRKRNRKHVVALSEVEIRLRSENGKDICIRKLEESDRRFSMMNTNPWDWQSVRTRSLTVRFAVEWYDLTIFSERRDAFQDTDHIAMYSDFGVTLDEISVTHFLVDDAGERTSS
ncbi:MAG: hypothetical protein OXQ89_24180 [Rhodospirillaceae bacterium]|nr:hypothetical protein [Rhodospirillaceae bacterium]